MPEPDSNKTTRMSWIISPRPFRRWLFSGLCLLALSACGTVPNRPAEDGAVRWEIRDSGIGVPRAAQARLFEKFFRAENAHTVETEGTGLGLALAHRIVEEHHGSIELRSTVGKGTTVFVNLPIDR